MYPLTRLQIDFINLFLDIYVKGDMSYNVVFNIYRHIYLEYNKIIKEDNLFLLLRNEISELEKLLENILFKEDVFFKNTNRRFKRFRNTINATEKQFGILKYNFNNYCHSLLAPLFLGNPSININKIIDFIIYCPKIFFASCIA